MRKVKNKNRKFGANPYYYHDIVNGKDALFSENQIAVAYDTAGKNEEDIPPRDEIETLNKAQKVNVAILFTIATIGIAVAVHFGFITNDGIKETALTLIAVMGMYIAFLKDKQTRLAIKRRKDIESENHALRQEVELLNR